MKNIKLLVPALMITSSILLSGCGGKTGKTATNIDTSTGEVLSQDSLDTIKDETIKNINKIILNAPSLDNISISDNITKYDLTTEIEKRKNNFVLCGKEDKVSESDKVNISFIEITLASGEAVYELNLGYDFDLTSDLDSSFKNGLIGHAVGEKVTIENCKMPDGTVSKVKVKINYITRKAENLDSLNSLLPENAENYNKWLESSLEKAAIVNDIWDQILKQASIDHSTSDFKDYFNRKYENAYEYYTLYNGENVDEATLKAVIEAQAKKEFVAYYYANEYDISIGEYKDEEIKNIALYYGYTVEAFKAKYSKDVIDTTILIDLVGQKMYEEIAK